MRAKEFIGEDIATTSASIAPVAQSLGHTPMISRMARPVAPHKYRAPKTKRNKNASGIS